MICVCACEYGNSGCFNGVPDGVCGAERNFDAIVDATLTICACLPENVWCKKASKSRNKNQSQLQQNHSNNKENAHILNNVNVKRNCSSMLICLNSNRILLKDAHITFVAFLHRRLTGRAKKQNSVSEALYLFSHR